MTHMTNDTTGISRVVAARPPHTCTAVLVLGAPTTGMSPLAALARHLNAIAPDGADAELNAAVGALSERILTAIGPAWNDPALPLVPQCDAQDSAMLIKGAIEEQFLDEAVALLNGARQPVTVLANPTLSLLSLFWLKALRASGFATRVVLVARDPVEVAQAMQQRFNLNQYRSLRLWAKHTIAALNACLAEPASMVVPFDHLFDPTQAAALAANLFAAEGQARPNGDTVGAVIDPTRRTRTAAPGALANAPVMPSLVRHLHDLLREWGGMAPDRRVQAVRDLRAAFADQSIFGGSVAAVRLPRDLMARLPRVEPNPARGTRKLLLHYHLFKNAGTSVDAILRRNFGGRWMNTEFASRPPNQHQAEITHFVQNHPALLAISSHTMMLPPPILDGVEVFPILFIRHPIDRLRSAYDFEREQKADTEGARLAKQHDFAGYLRTHLAHPSNRACRDFQTARLAMCVPASAGSELHRARVALDQLPFVGLVEAFQASIGILQERVQHLFPGFRGFQVWQNSTRSHGRALEKRLTDVRHELGDELYDIVTTANKSDLELYQMVHERYERA